MLGVQMTTREELIAFWNWDRLTSLCSQKGFGIISEGDREVLRALKSGYDKLLLDNAELKAKLNFAQQSSQQNAEERDELQLKLNGFEEFIHRIEEIKIIRRVLDKVIERMDAQDITTTEPPEDLVHDDTYQYHE